MTNDAAASTAVGRKPRSAVQNYVGPGKIRILRGANPPQRGLQPRTVPIGGAW